MTKFRAVWRGLWRDERGGLLSTEYIILGSLLTLGLIVGITAARNSLSTELEDYAEAVSKLNTNGAVSTALNGDSPVTFAGNEGGFMP